MLWLCQMNIPIYKQKLNMPFATAIITIAINNAIFVSVWCFFAAVLSLYLAYMIHHLVAAVQFRPKTWPKLQQVRNPELIPPYIFIIASTLTGRRLLGDSYQCKRKKPAYISSA